MSRGPLQENCITHFHHFSIHFSFMSWSTNFMISVVSEFHFFVIVIFLSFRLVFSKSIQIMYKIMGMQLRLSKN
jgi:hypothetical protein